jgi:hypothetical protein
VSGWIVFGPEEVFVDEGDIPVNPKHVRDGEWIGTEKQWRDFIEANDLVVETSDEDYAILNNKAVFVGTHYDDDYGGRGHFDDEY